MYFKRKYSLENDNLDRQFKALPDEIKDHCIRVGVSSETMAQYAVNDLCRIYNLDDRESNLKLKLLSYIYDGGVYHDIGKLMINESDDTISNSLKRSLVELHPIISERILSLDNTAFTNDVQKKIILSMAKYHHESYSGTGYPSRCKGDCIPLPAQICAIANLYDVLVEKRFENEEYAFDAAKKTIEENRRMNFSEQAINCFTKAADEIKQLYTNRKNFRLDRKSEMHTESVTENTPIFNNSEYLFKSNQKTNRQDNMVTSSSTIVGNDLTAKITEYENEKKKYENKIENLNQQILDELNKRKNEIDELINKVQNS